MKKAETRFLQNLLLILTITSVVFGVIAGGLLRYLQLSSNVIKLIKLPGDLFMNMLKATILPLIVASLISAKYRDSIKGLSQLDGQTSGKIGRRAVLYYILTTAHAVLVRIFFNIRFFFYLKSAYGCTISIIKIRNFIQQIVFFHQIEIKLGIAVVMLLHPGDPQIKFRRLTTDDKVAVNVTTIDKFLDLIRNLVPENIIRSTFQQQQTVYVTVNTSSGQTSTTKIEYTDGMNVLGELLSSKKLIISSYAKQHFNVIKQSLIMHVVSTSIHDEGQFYFFIFEVLIIIDFELTTEVNS
ncbi:hypothetical protein DICVIV_12734 [Dictyocaulus viviparus]|uniref:Amino acid transporter n=1 Tax=Dictyocaulus viviparus TaxID=29172 RepID=A0A0D8XCB9_DICVI|nr:hypothetical protein DICVIV_12734 [Dictyocaulus viviparus]